METTNPKPFVFVLMPFSSEFSDIYEVGIKPACKDAGAYCERVDEQIFDENILERVYNQIAKADVIISEMTGRNPNVFYETGYAHALNKRVILLTRNADDIPFDLKHFPHIVYEGKIALLKTQLEARVRWCVENPQISPSSVDVDVDLLINGTNLFDSPEICLFSADSVYYDDADATKVMRFDLTVSIHNRMKKLLDPQSLSLALVVPKAVDASGETASYSHFPDGRMLCTLIPKFSLFPDGWQFMNFSLYFKENVLLESEAGALDFDTGEMSTSSLVSALQLFTAVGPKEYKFFMKLRRRA